MSDLRAPLFLLIGRIDYSPSLVLGLFGSMDALMVVAEAETGLDNLSVIVVDDLGEIRRRWDAEEIIWIRANLYGRNDIPGWQQGAIAELRAAEVLR